MSRFSYKVILNGVERSPATLNDALHFLSTEGFPYEKIREISDFFKVKSFTKKTLINYNDNNGLVIQMGYFEQTGFIPVGY
jgi:hypothetical protein